VSARASILVRVVALVALAGVALALTVLLAASGGTYKTTAVFEDVRGLIGGASVKAGGVPVGKVSDIRFGADGLPRVTMAIDEDFRLRRSAFADVRLQSNAGSLNRYVELIQGNGPELPEGAVLGPERTDEPVNLDQAFSDLDPETRADVAHILAALDHATRKRGDHLARALRYSAGSLSSTADLLDQVSTDKAALQTLVADGRRLVSALARSRGDLGASVDTVAALLRTTARRQGELAQTSRLLGPGMASARATLDRVAQALPNLRAVTRDARPVVAEIPETVRLLRPAIAATAPVLRQTRQMIEEAPAQLRALNPVIEAARRMFPLFGPTMAKLGPLLDLQRVYAPEFVGFFALGADTAGNYDANGNVIRVSPIMIETARHTNAVSPSSDAPGLVPRPFIRTPGALEGEPWTDFRKTFLSEGSG
jgi:phospholipid/cholesterol/gamma-HCH transport system substrate-binding protein